MNLSFGTRTLLEDGDILGGITQFFQGLFDSIAYFIPKLLYWLCASILQIVDLCQSLFRKLVGLDTYYVAGSEVEQSGDIIFSIFKNTFLGEGTYKAMNTAFWSITLLGLILLFVTTIAGLLRNEYSPDKEKLNSKSGVVKNALKAVASLILIPLTCFFCLFIGNAVIVAVDAATQPLNSATVAISEEVAGFTDYELDNGKKTAAAFCLWGANVPTPYTPISGIMFRSACYNANRARLDANFFNDVILYEGEIPDGYTTNFGAFNMAEDRDHCATMIDEAFELNIRVTNPAKLYDAPGIDKVGANSGIFSTNATISNMSRFNVGLVSYYYNLWHFDFVVAFAFAIFIGKLFLEVTLGLMQRIIEIMALLFFLPIVLSFMPVDDSAGFKKWRAHFITKTLSAYVTIISFNIFFIIYPLLRGFRFFESGLVFDAVNNIVSAIFVLAGLLSIKTINEMFATMFMIDKITANAMKSGEAAMQGTMQLAEKGVKATVGLAKIPLAPVAGIMKHGFAAGKAKFTDWAADRRDSRRKAAVDAATDKARQKSYQDGAEEAYKNSSNKTADMAQDAVDYQQYRNQGEETFANDYIRRQAIEENNSTGLGRGGAKLSGAALENVIQRRQRDFQADQTSNKELMDKINRYKKAESDGQEAGEKAGKKFDQRQQARQEGVKAGVGAAASGVSTPLGFLKDLVGWDNVFGKKK